MAAKLHELLAVEGDLEGIFKKIVQETIATFTKKPEHFLSWHKQLQMFDSEREKEQVAAEEHKEMVTTVMEKLDYSKDSMIRYFDAILQKELTNQIAKADLTVDGVVIGKDLPATFLLGMETRLKIVRGIYEAIPTLSPGIRWVEDKESGKGIYKADKAEVKSKTEKTFQSKILVEPTKEHPAQIEKWSENVAIGDFVTERWSGMLSPAEKSQVLKRINDLIQAVKKARQRANTTEVIKNNVGSKLFDYIHG